MQTQPNLSPVNRNLYLTRATDNSRAALATGHGGKGKNREEEPFKSSPP